MSRRRTSQATSPNFSRLLTRTIVLSIVFSAGLITGQRLLHQQSLPPLVSVPGPATATPAISSTARRADPGDEQAERPTFSFFDQLSRPAEGARPVVTKRKAPEPAKAVEKAPARAPEPTKVAEPAKAPEPAKAAEPAKATEPAPAIAAAVAEPVRPTEPAAAPAHAQAQAPADAAAATEPAKAADPAPPAAQQPAAQLPARYTLQVGSYPTLEIARRESERLRKLGMEPHVIAADVPGQGKFFRVRVGKFHSMDEARNFQAEIQQRNSLETFVTPL